MNANSSGAQLPWNGPLDAGTQCTNEQIPFALRRAENGAAIAESVIFSSPFIEELLNRFRQILMRFTLAFVLGLAIIQPAGSVPDQAPPSRSTGLSHRESHPSCRNAEYEIRLTIKNVRKSVGLIVAELYPDDPVGFLSGETRLAISRFAALAPETELCLQPPGPGHYAVSVYQDENANTDFDRTFLGLPAEPWGLSNNPRVGLKGPRIEESLFTVNEAGADVTISLRH